MTKVSIIIPIYNAEKTIIRCLDSILNQTYKNIEIIAINDGSKDKSFNIVKEYINKLKNKKNIKLVNKKNEGVSITRNLGIELATGEYITFVDNDDYLEKQYIEKYIKEIKKSKYDLIIGGYKRVDQNGKKLFSHTLKKDSEWSKYIILTAWSKMYKKSFLIENKIKFLVTNIGEDVYFNLLAYSKKPKIKIINNDNYIWFYNNDSVSNTLHKGLNKKVDIINLLDKIKDIGFKDIYLKYFVKRFIIWYLLFSGRNSSKKEFVEELKRLKKWLEDNNISKTMSPLSLKIGGESFKNRLIILIFNLLDKFHLIPLFAKIYCKN